MPKVITSLLALCLALTLSSCKSEPTPLNVDTLKQSEISTIVESTEPQLSTVESPSDLSDSGADLRSLTRTKTKTEHITKKPETKALHITASHTGFAPSLLEVNKGDDVTITLESIDVKHSFVIPALGIRQIIPARSTSSFKLRTDLPGSYEFMSDIYSGKNTEELRGTLLVK